MLCAVILKSPLFLQKIKPEQMINNFKTTTKHYRKYMFMYGIMTVINVLEYYEFKEEYEECQKILDSIKEQEQRLNITLFTRNTKECLKEVIQTYKKHNLTGVNAIENSEYYATLVIKEIESNLRVLSV